MCEKKRKKLEKRKELEERERERERERESVRERDYLIMKKEEIHGFDHADEE